MYHQHFRLKTCIVSNINTTTTHVVTLNHFHFLKLLPMSTCRVFIEQTTTTTTAAAAAAAAAARNKPCTRVSPTLQIENISSV